MPEPSRPCWYSGFKLYAARVDVGLKHRRPTDAHCACVGGVSFVETCVKSLTVLTVGCGTGNAAASPCEPPAVAAMIALTPRTAAATPNFRFDAENKVLPPRLFTGLGRFPSGDRGGTLLGRRKRCAERRYHCSARGGVAERSNAAVSKTVIRR